MTPAELRQWRDRLGMTQEQLADALSDGREPKIAPLTVSRWERGEATPQPYIRLALERLAMKRRKR